VRICGETGAASAGAANVVGAGVAAAVTSCADVGTTNVELVVAGMAGAVGLGTLTGTDELVGVEDGVEDGVTSGVGLGGYLGLHGVPGAISLALCAAFQAK
jgi:hypothetical protein